MIPNGKFSEGLKIQTEKALKTINQYQKLRQIPNHTLFPSILTQPNSHNALNIRIFQPKQKVKLQLFSNCLTYYKMHIVPNIDPKLIIRHLKGGPLQIYVFYDKLLKQLQQAAHHFYVKDQIIFKLSKKRIQQSKSIILVFKNSTYLCMLTFRIDLIKPPKHKISQLKTDKSFDSIDLALQSLDSTQNKLKRSKSRQKHKSTSLYHRKIVSVSPEQKQKRINQQKQLKLQKIQAIKKRIQNLEIYKQKNSQATKVVASCKKMFSTYQSLVKEQQQKKKKIIKANAPLFYIIKYCLLSSIFFNEQEKNAKRIITIKSFQKKFIRKIRMAYHDTKFMQPDQNLRQLQVFAQFNTLMGYTLHKKSQGKAVNIVFNTFNQCFPGFIINLAMNQSNNYRRIVRGVQKRWKSKFQARTSMLIKYTQQQMEIIFDNYPHLKYVQKQYKQANSSYKICIQYQKQTSSKMIHLIHAYYQRLQQIQEYEQMNRQIKQFNATALKKRQKQLLEVPKKPAFPFFRFFRDILFLKSMVRSQLQVLFRKFKKKNPQLFVNKTQEQVQNKTKGKNNK